MGEDTETPEWKTFWRSLGSTRNSIFTDGVIRYLGIFLETKEDVAREWEERITRKIKARYAKWLSLRAGSTAFGKNIAIKNSVMAIAWYMTNNQTPPDLDDLIAQWEKDTWYFYEAPRAGSESTRQRDMSLKDL